MHVAQSETGYRSLMTHASLQIEQLEGQQQQASERSRSVQEVTPGSGGQQLRHDPAVIGRYDLVINRDLGRCNLHALMSIYLSTSICTQQPYADPLSVCAQGTPLLVWWACMPSR